MPLSRATRTKIQAEHDVKVRELHECQGRLELVGRSVRAIRRAFAEENVNMPKDIPSTAKCPVCESTEVHEVPADLVTPTHAPQVAHLWACEQCRNIFRLLEAAGDQSDTHFDL